MSARVLRAIACGAFFAAAAAFALPPQSVKASYDVYRNGFQVAVAQEAFERNGARYRIVGEVSPAGLLALLFRTHVKMLSSGSVTPAGLRPEQFEYGRLDDASQNVSAQFDWNASVLRMTFAERQETAPISPGAQDRLSVMYQFLFLPPEGLRDLAFQMTNNGKKIEHYHYRLAGSEQIDTPIGRLDTLHLVKQREPDDNAVEIWLARDRMQFPVRLVILENDGSKFEQIITRLEFE